MQTTLTVPSRLIRAAMLHCAQKDIRYYLNGICFEPSGDGVAIAATDGHRFFITHLSGQAIPAACIVPFELFKGVKSSHDRVVVEVDGRAVSVSPSQDNSMAAQIQSRGLLIDGVFPDWRRLFTSHTPADGAVIHNPDYAADAAKALAIVAGSKSAHIRYARSSGDAAWFTRSDAPKTAVLVMGMRAAAVEELLDVGSVVASFGAAPAAAAAEAVA